MSSNIDIGRSLNCSDTFPRRKFENWVPTSCRPGPILSTSSISFDVHVKVAEAIDLEMCSYGQLSEVQMVCHLDLDLGSGKGHVSIHSMCRTTCVLNHVTVVSRTTEIWPFEFRQKCTFRNFGSSVTLTLTFRWGRGHTVAHM